MSGVWKANREGKTMHIYRFRYEPALLVAAVQIAACACCGDKHNDIGSGNRRVDKFLFWCVSALRAARDSGGVLCDIG